MGRRKGAQITLGLCSCGHPKLFHMTSERSGAEGHGVCAVSDCGCDKYTWIQCTTKIRVKDTPEAWAHWRRRNFEYT